GRPAYGFDAVGERIDGVSEGPDFDFATSKRSNRRREWTAARAHHGELLDDYRGEIERRGAGVRALEDQRATRSNGADSDGKAGRRSSCLDDEVMRELDLFD